MCFSIRDIHQLMWNDHYWSWNDHRDNCPFHDQNGFKASQIVTSNQLILWNEHVIHLLIEQIGMKSHRLSYALTSTILLKWPCATKIYKWLIITKKWKECCLSVWSSLFLLMTYFQAVSRYRDSLCWVACSQSESHKLYTQCNCDFLCFVCQKLYGSM